MAQPPCNFVYTASLSTLSWDPSVDGNLYEIEVCIAGQSTWVTIYTGSNMQCPFNYPTGKYFIRGKSKKSGDLGWGPLSTPQEISVV